MLDIFKRVAIGVSIAMIVWFLKSEVFALSVNSRVEYTDDGSSVSTSYVSSGSLMSFTTPNDNSEFTFTRVFVRFVDNYSSGSFYRFEYNYNISRYDYEFTNLMCPDSFYTSSGATILSSSCSFQPGSPTVHVTLTVQFEDDLSGVTFGSIYFVPLLRNTTYNFRVLTDYSVSNIDGTYQAIINNTTQISGVIDGVGSKIDVQTAIIETINNLLYQFTNATIGDESATNRSTSYSGMSVNGYESAHSSGTSAGGSGVDGANGLSFNFSPFTTPFTFVFSKIEDFLSINATFMIYLINMITLGFIGLVLNR